MGPGVRVYGLVDARLCRAVALRSSAACARHLSSMPLHSASSTSIPITHSGVGDFTLRSGVRLGFHNTGVEEAHPVSIILLAMLCGSVFWMLLCLYCDMVLPIGPGVKRHPLFLFFPSTYSKASAKQVTDVTERVTAISRNRHLA